MTAHGKQSATWLLAPTNNLCKMLKLFVGFFLLFMVVLLGTVAVKPVMTTAQKYPKVALLVVGSACLAVILGVIIVVLL